MTLADPQQAPPAQQRSSRYEADFQVHIRTSDCQHKTLARAQLTKGCLCPPSRSYVCLDVAGMASWLLRSTV